MGVLGGFASAVVLAVVALLMAGESAQRMAAPMPIRFDQAIVVATVGLCVNLACAFLLRDDHDHRHPHEHAHHAAHGHGRHDLNLRAAYLHVLADALTSMTAIVALLAGKFFGWSWLDPVMGIVGTAFLAPRSRGRPRPLPARGMTVMTRRP